MSKVNTVRSVVSKRAKVLGHSVVAHTRPFFFFLFLCPRIDAENKRSRGTASQSGESGTRIRDLFRSAAKKGTGCTDSGPDCIDVESKLTASVNVKVAPFRTLSTPSALNPAGAFVTGRANCRKCVAQPARFAAAPIAPRDCY